MNELREGVEEAHPLLHVLEHVLLETAPEGLVERSAARGEVLEH